MDRETELLINLQGQFKDPQMQAGKDTIENGYVLSTVKRCTELDRLLSFYVLIAGVKAAGEVPEASLSICFRFWLAHYYYKEPEAGSPPPERPHPLRAYVNKNYPTLRKWLLMDAQKSNREESFFRPHDFWPAHKIELNGKKLWPDAIE